MSALSEEEMELRRDAVALSKHLVGELPSDTEVEAYVRAHGQLGLGFSSSRDRRLWALVRRHPWLLRFFDAGLAVLDPASDVRRRLVVMLAILEASPAHCERFLPDDTNHAAIPALIISAVVGGYRLAVGVVTLKVLRLR